MNTCINCIALISPQRDLHFLFLWFGCVWLAHSKRITKWLCLVHFTCAWKLCFIGQCVRGSSSCFFLSLSLSPQPRWWWWWLCAQITINMKFNWLEPDAAVEAHKLSHCNIIQFESRKKKSVSFRTHSLHSRAYLCLCHWQENKIHLSIFARRRRFAWKQIKL